MGGKNVFYIIDYFKKNRLKILTLAIITLLSSLLIIAAINMLQFPGLNSNSPKRDSNNNKSKTAENNAKSKNNNQNNQNGQNNNRDNAVKGGESIPNNIPDNDDQGMGNRGNEILKALPDVSIDLSRPDISNNVPSEGGGNSFSVRSGAKPKHEPLFEVYGKTYTPFLKLIAMENYSNDKWTVAENPHSYPYKWEKPEGMIGIKVQPLSPAKGFIPLISNAETAVFPGATAYNYPELGASYTESEINYYEMFYKQRIPGTENLRYLQIDTSVTYNIESMHYFISLAESLTENSETPYDKIKAIETYLNNNYLYINSNDLSINSEAINGSSMERFIHTKKGTQLDFVSTFVTLIRCVGVPAHIATGYRINPSLPYQIVYADQLYVYPEVKYEEYGWVPLDVFNNFKPFVPPVKTQNVIESLDTVIKKGTEFQVIGKVTDNLGKPVDGLPVLIYLKKNKNEDCLSIIKGTVLKGVFDMTSNLKEDTEVGKYQVVAHTLENDTYIESWSDPELKIIADTDIQFDAPASVTGGKSFLVKGVISELLTKKSVNGGKVDVQFDKNLNVIQSSDGKVDKAGNFTCEYKLTADKDSNPVLNLFFARKYEGSYIVCYRGSELYLPCQKTGQVKVWVVFWDRIIILLILVVLIPLSIIIILKRKKLMFLFKRKNKADVTKFQVESEDLEQPLNEITKKNGIYIYFPQIEKTFPDVWEVLTPLTIRLADDEGNYEDAVQVFETKGNKRITVYTVTGHELTGARNILIVCYREEIIRLGKILFDRLNVKYNMVSSKLTPREILEVISNKLNPGTEGNFERLIALFEMAAYSDGTPGRSAYEEFYSLQILVESVMKEE